MLDLTKIFKKVIEKSEGPERSVEWAVYTLKTEFSADPKISQQAADALDVLYNLAAGSVPKAAVREIVNNLRVKRDAFEAAGFYINADDYTDAICEIKKNIKGLEDEDGLSEDN